MVFMAVFGLFSVSLHRFCAEMVFAHIDVS